MFTTLALLFVQGFPLCLLASGPVCFTLVPSQVPHRCAFHITACERMFLLIGAGVTDSLFIPATGKGRERVHCAGRQNPEHFCGCLGDLVWGLSAAPQSSVPTAPLACGPPNPGTAGSLSFLSEMLLYGGELGTHAEEGLGRGG